MRVAAFTTLVALAARAIAEPPPDLPGDDCWDMPPDLQQSIHRPPNVRGHIRPNMGPARDLSDMRNLFGGLHCLKYVFPSKT